MWSVTCSGQGYTSCYESAYLCLDHPVFYLLMTPVPISPFPITSHLCPHHPSPALPRAFILFLLLGSAGDVTPLPVAPPLLPAPPPVAQVTSPAVPGGARCPDIFPVPSCRVRVPSVPAPSPCVFVGAHTVASAAARVCVSLASGLPPVGRSVRVASPRHTSPERTGTQPGSTPDTLAFRIRFPRWPGVLMDIFH